MRDRLIELIEQKQVYGVDQEQERPHEIALLDNDVLADHLLANGVIVPLVRLEQKVYMPDDEWGRIEAVVENIEITHSGLCYEFVKYDVGVDETEVWDYGTFRDKDIGKTVFLSFEDYEKALAERSEG